MDEDLERLPATDDTVGRLMELKEWAGWGRSLVGRVFDNPKFNDGDVITTSPVDFYYVVAVTKTGSHYVLDGSRISFLAIDQE